MSEAYPALHPLPATIAEVTPTWLTATLARHPAWNGRTIVSVEAQSIGELDSLASAVYVANVRVRQRDRSVAVVRLLLKLHHPDPDHRDDAGYAAEAWFYRELAAALEALRAARTKGWPRIGAVIDRWEEHEQKPVTDMRPEYIFCDTEGLPGEGDLKIDGVQLAVFEVTDASLALTLAARGAGFVETFAIGEMIREISRLAKSP